MQRRYEAFGPVLAVNAHAREDEAGWTGVAGLEEFMKRNTLATVAS